MPADRVPFANDGDKTVRTLPLREQFALARVSIQVLGIVARNHRLQDFRKGSARLLEILSAGWPH
jgi:hypothetical protein